MGYQGGMHGSRWYTRAAAAACGWMDGEVICPWEPSAAASILLSKLQTRLPLSPVQQPEPAPDPAPTGAGAWDCARAHQQHPGQLPPLLQGGR